jgi:hypothetical protein
LSQSPIGEKNLNYLGRFKLEKVEGKKGKKKKREQLPK